MPALYCIAKRNAIRNIINKRISQYNSSYIQYDEVRYAEIQNSEAGINDQ